MIPVLEVCNKLGLGGTEKTTQIFCKYLDRNKFYVHSCGFFEGGAREKLIEKSSSGHFIAKGNPEVFYNYLAKNDIKIIHWHGLERVSSKEVSTTIQLLKHCKNNGIRVIETSPFPTHQQEIDNLLDKRLFVSKTALLKFLWKYNPSNKLKYDFLYNPVDDALLKNLEITKTDILQFKKSAGIAENELVICRIGRKDWWRWDTQILTVGKILLSKGIRFKLLFRSAPSEFISKVKEYGLSSFVINLKDTSDELEIAKTYQASNIVLQVGRLGETFGCAIAEAMFFGKPVVVNSTDFTKFTLFDRNNAQIELVNNGVNGFVVNNNEKIADTVIKLAQDAKLYNNIACCGKESVLNNFSAKKLTTILERHLVSNNYKTENNFLSLKKYKEVCPNESLKDVFVGNCEAVSSYFWHKVGANRGKS